MTPQTATFTTCQCGWIGVSHSTPDLIEMWYEHVMSVRDGVHYRLGGGAIAVPIPPAGMAGIVREARGLNELGMFRSAERRGLEMVSVRRRAEEREWLGQAENGLRRGALNALGFTLVIVGVVGIVLMVVWRLR